EWPSSGRSPQKVDREAGRPAFRFLHSLASEQISAKPLARARDDSKCSRIFGLEAHGTNVRREVVAGCTTFRTIAYIMFVNPKILSAAGLDQNAVFVATCAATAATTQLMGSTQTYPCARARHGSKVENPKLSCCKE